MDATDRKILQLLQENGRLSMQKLAAQINMSSPATAERVRKLEEAGAISGYAAQVNADRLGLPTHAFVVATVPMANRPQVYRYLEQNSAIVRAYYVLTGGPDVILEIFSPTPAELDKLQQDLFHLAQTVTYLVRNEPVKDQPLLPPTEAE